LLLDQKNQDVLTKPILLRRHIVLWVREKTWLKDGGKILRGHLVQIRLGRKHGEQIEDVKQQLSVERRELGDQGLIGTNGVVGIEMAFIGRL